MNTEVVFIIIVVFLVADFIVERILEWVNMRAMAPVLPENLTMKKNMHVFRIISAKRIVSI